MLIKDMSSIVIKITRYLHRTIHSAFHIRCINTGYCILILYTMDIVCDGYCKRWILYIYDGYCTYRADIVYDGYCIGLILFTMDIVYDGCCIR